MGALWPRLLGLDVADFLDDGVADDAGCDGEYWEEHGKSPLLSFFVVLPGCFPDIQLCAKPVPKGKMRF